MDKLPIKKIKELSHQVLDLEASATDLLNHALPHELLAAVDGVISLHQRIQQTMRKYDINTIWKLKLVKRLAKALSTAHFGTYAYGAGSRIPNAMLNVPKPVANAFRVPYVQIIDQFLTRCKMSNKTRKGITATLRTVLEGDFTESSLPESIILRAAATSIFLGDDNARDWLLSVGDRTEDDGEVTQPSACPAFSTFTGYTLSSADPAKEVKKVPAKELHKVDPVQQRNNERAREQLHAELRAAVREATRKASPAETPSAYDVDESFLQGLTTISSGTLDSDEPFFD